MNALLTKWWLLLIQGILLILASIFIFRHPAASLAGLSIWFATLILLAGIVSTILYFKSDKEERDWTDLLWGLLTVLIGILMITNLGATMITVTFMFGLWMILTGVSIFSSGWKIRGVEGSNAWLIIVIGALSIIAGLMVAFNFAIGTVTITVLFGLQVLLAGLGLVFLAFLKKKAVKNINEKVESIRSELKG
jgi:uncharacterized membrane protein HdeD (DUF308 family)